MQRINTENLLHCKEAYRISFSVTRDDGTDVHRGITLFKFDGADFFPLKALQNGHDLAEYHIEILDFARMLLDWKDERRTNEETMMVRADYFALAMSMAGRLIHKQTGEKIYGFFKYDDMSMYELFYEKEGFFYPWEDHTRQYMNPIYYPTSRAAFSFLEAGDGYMPDAEGNAVLNERLREVEALSVIYGKLFFQDFDEGRSHHSFYQSEKWWTEEKVQEAIANKLSMEREGLAKITNVSWQEDEDIYGRTTLHACKLSLSARLQEYCFDNRKGSSYKGIYRFEKEWSMDITKLLRAVNRAEAYSKKVFQMEGKMQEQARLLEGKEVHILYCPLGIRMVNGALYLTIHVKIPEIYMEQDPFSTRTQGMFLESNIDVKVEKI